MVVIYIRSREVPEREAGTILLDTLLPPTRWRRDPVLQDPEERLLSIRSQVKRDCELSTGNELLSRSRDVNQLQ